MLERSCALPDHDRKRHPLLMLRVPKLLRLQDSLALKTLKTQGAPRAQGTVPADFLEGGEPPKAAKGLALALALAPLDEDDEEVDSVTRVRSPAQVQV